MYLTGITHRDRVFKIATRWLCDWLEPEDGRFITEVFIYESMASGPTVRRFHEEVLASVHTGEFRRQRVYVKDEVRRAIVECCERPTVKMQALFEQFRVLPEEFFPRTPVDLILTWGEEGRLLGMTRIKRIRRIAEKASRRVADRLAGRIMSTARSLAEVRAQAMGVELEELVTPPEVMSHEFSTAERIISQAFRDRRIDFEPQDLKIDDIVGMKFIGTEDELRAIEHAIEDHPRATIVEREEHRGTYNDINLLVEIELPPPVDIIERMRGRNWGFAARRGSEPEELRDGFPAYVASAARTLRMEVILTSYKELVESEFGRSIHEERIIDQRRRAPYAGRIASNVSYILEYLLMLAIAPTVEVKSLPVKMWGRYLPDTFHHAVWELFGIEHDVVVGNRFSVRGEEARSREEVLGLE